METRILDESDLPQIILLYESSFGKKSAIEFWKWKHFKSPFGKSVTFGGFIDSQLVASISLSRTDFQLKDKILKAYQSTDTMVGADWKGKGLGRKIVEAQGNFLKNDAQFDLAYYFPQHWTTKLYTDYGCELLDKVHLFLKSTAQIKLGQLLSKKRKFEVIEPADFNWDDFFTDFKNSPFSINYSSAFFRWKLNNPKYTYKIIQLIENDEKSIAVINITSSGVVQIADLLCSNEKNKSSLVSAIEQYTLQDKLKGVLAMTVVGCKFSKLLLRKGFIVNPFKKGPYSSNLDFLVYSENSTYLSLFSKSNWSLNPIIYDDI